MIKSRQVILIVFVIILLTVLFFFPKTSVNIEKIEEIKNNLGILAPLAFIVFFSVSSVFFMPVTFLTIASGVIFGPLWGTVYSVISATIGACLAFLMSRYLFRDFIYRISPSKISKLEKLVKKNAWELIIITTINPIINFNLENYFFGVTDIPLKTFFWATLISLIPGSVAFAYLGHTGIRLLSGNRFILDAVVTVCLFVLIAFMPYIVRHVRNHFDFN